MYGGDIVINSEENDVSTNAKEDTHRFTQKIHILGGTLADFQLTMTYTTDGVDEPYGFKTTNSTYDNFIPVPFVSAKGTNDDLRQPDPFSAIAQVNWDVTATPDVDLFVAEQRIEAESTFEGIEFTDRWRRPAPE